MSFALSLAGAVLSFVLGHEFARDTEVSRREGRRDGGMTLRGEGEWVPVEERKGRWKGGKEGRGWKGTGVKGEGGEEEGKGFKVCKNLEEKDVEEEWGKNGMGGRNGESVEY